MHLQVANAACLNACMTLGRALNVIMYVGMGLRLVPRISMDFSPLDGSSPRVAGCLQDVAKATVSMSAEKL
ncbi:hypothetical protein ACA877_000228 [Vibrio alginolyticus]|uniref:hypothetical protein n=1 Tax=Vibrio alginolyticus TaxID=663 RepID=UPI0028074894|nr:hypothetical protein [Vibrio alginolyticus]